MAVRCRSSVARERGRGRFLLLTYRVVTIGAAPKTPGDMPNIHVDQSTSESASYRIAGRC